MATEAAALPEPGLRLFCFPHSGAGASAYRDWGKGFGPVRVVPVQYPGHESRYGEPLHRRMAPLIERLAADLGPGLEPPFAFFGHSLGALVAFELASHLVRGGGPGPGHLFVSACRAPHVPNPFPPLYRLPDTRFREVIARLGAGAGAALEDAEFWRLFEPILRADFEISDTYECAPEPSLDCPVSAFGGRDDPFVEPAALEAWRDLTRGSFCLRLFPGGHFYHLTAGGAATQVPQAILADLAPALGEGRTQSE